MGPALAFSAARDLRTPDAAGRPRIGRGRRRLAEGRSGCYFRDILVVSRLPRTADAAAGPDLQGAAS